MQDLLKFIVRYGNFLVFLLLEVVAFLLLMGSAAYPRSSVLSTANSFVGAQYRMVSNVRGYFSLRAANDALTAENSALYDRIHALETQLDDSLRGPVVRQGQLRYIPARVVQADICSHHNYLTIDRGSCDGICSGMGVRSEGGVVGIISTVSDHYAVVIPSIHTRSNLSCRFLKDDYVATLQWDGGDIRYASLGDVAIHEPVTEGDTIVASGLTTAFPEGVPVGVVEECRLKEGDSYYTVRVRLLTDFRRLRYVQVIANSTADEIKQLTTEPAQH